MRTSLGLLVVTVAAAQTPAADRTFQFQHTDGAQNILEVATLIRTIGDIRDVDVNEVKKTLEVRGNEDQLSLTAWLFNQLDQPQIPASQNQDAVARKYTMNSGSDDVVELFHLNSTPTIQSFQEAATMIRTVADIRHVFTYNAAHALVIRSTPDQAAVAEWLVNQIEHPDAAGSPEYRMPPSSDPHGETVVHVFHVAHTATVQSFQEIATAIRTIADIRRVFTHNERRMITIRGSADQIGLAEWLLPLLDLPAIGEPGAPSTLASAAYNYQTPFDGDNVVRVFYLHNPTIQGFQQTATQVRTTTNLRRVFTYNAPRAMAVRGTVDQVNAAERMVKESEEGAKNRE